MSAPVKGFSKLSKKAKMEWLASQHFKNPTKAIEILESYWHPEAKVQKLHDDFIENTITNYFLPFGIAPNFLINGKIYTLPMAIEESSVVAAASKAASFWGTRGGFKTRVISTRKIGHVHFIYQGNADWLRNLIESSQNKFLEDCGAITANMRNRGGGIVSIELVDRSDAEPNYYQIQVKFETCDSMGANFINSCLEQIAKTLQSLIEENTVKEGNSNDFQIVMCILSNYTPECIVRAEVSCPIEDLQDGSDISPEEFIEKFQRAIRIAHIETYRATTHNKGIFNGIDAVVIATGNDFRAVEAAGHTYAARKGSYQSLTDCAVKDGVFHFWIELPLALGTVGGLTSLHPLVKLAHEMLGNPNAEELMMIVACSGLAQNFGALRALVTTGIQKGHMKMHLFNILNQLEATDKEKEIMIGFFSDKVVAHNEVIRKFCEIRGVSYESFVGRSK